MGRGRLQYLFNRCCKLFSIADPATIVLTFMPKICWHYSKKMTYSVKELAALLRLGYAMAQVDGHVDDIESFAISSELKGFGINESNVGPLIAIAASMDFADAIATVAVMSTEQKKYATGYLAAIMAANGEIAEAEVKLWQLICTFASFPTMNITDALSFWTCH